MCPDCTTTAESPTVITADEFGTSPPKRPGNQRSAQAYDPQPLCKSLVAICVGLLQARFCMLDEGVARQNGVSGVTLTDATTPHLIVSSRNVFISNM